MKEKQKNIDKRALMLLVCLSFPVIVFSQKMAADVKAYRVNISPDEVTDLKERLMKSRWPDAVKNSGWEYGTELSYLKSLVEYWAKSFDWSSEQQKLNVLKQYTVEIDGQTIHFIYERGKTAKTTPIVLLHGWPSSFLQMKSIIPILTAGDKNGNSFDVIVPSLIGYGFSSPSSKKGMNVYQMSEIFQKLISEKLGYQKFVLRASDIGAGVAKEWAISHPENIRGLHLSGSNPYNYNVPNDLSEEEKKYLEKGQQFMMAEGAYAMEQSTKPQTLAYALNDSPVGLAAWIIEKFYAWSDNGGNLESKFTKDEMLTNISLYWFTQSIGSSMRAYYESAHNWSPNANKKVIVPTAFLMLSHDISIAPRKWEERTYNIVRWNLNRSGGHFGEWEEPSIVASDIRAFVESLK